MNHTLSSPEQWLYLYGDILYRYSISRVHNTDVAEDLVQETLLAALKAKENYVGKSSEQTWLIGILKHKVLDHFRKTSKENFQAYDEQFEKDQSDDYFDQQGKWQVDLNQWSKPEKAIEHEQFMSTLHDCISRLPPKMAQLFILNEFENMQSEEICEMLAISTLNNFWVTLSRTRVQLRHCLDINWLKQ